MRGQWQISFDPALVPEKYKIPRGEAANFDDAVAVLFDGPTPEGYLPYEEMPDVYEYTRNGYRIVYEVLMDARPHSIRVIFFERL